MARLGNYMWAIRELQALQQEGHDVDFELGYCMYQLGRPLSIGEDACLSLVAGDHASLSLTGPAEIHGEGRGRVMELAISSGRGVLLVDATGATIHLGDHVVSIRNGALAFDVSASTQVWLLEGEGRLDGAALELAPNEAPRELEMDLRP